MMIFGIYYSLVATPASHDADARMCGMLIVRPHV